MAADTANQKVFVTLSGFSKVQDYIRTLEDRVDRHKGADSNTPAYADYTRALLHHKAAKTVIELLGLPIEVREYR